MADMVKTDMAFGEMLRNDLVRVLREGSGDMAAWSSCKAIADGLAEKLLAGCDIRRTAGGWPVEGDAARLDLGFALCDSLGIWLKGIGNEQAATFLTGLTLGLSKRGYFVVRKAYN